MNGEVSEKACAWDAAQASRAAVVEAFIVGVVMVVVVVVMGRQLSVSLLRQRFAAAGWLAGDCVSVARRKLPSPAQGACCRSLQPTAGRGGEAWQKPR